MQKSILVIGATGYLGGKELISTNYKTNQLVADYAAILNVSPNHLAKSIKAVTGKSATQWIDELIVLEAKVLLYQASCQSAKLVLSLALKIHRISAGCSRNILGRHRLIFASR